MRDTIVIIDTGIDLTNSFLGNHHIDGVSICKLREQGTYKVTSYSENKECIQDNLGHGTAVCGIISSHNTQANLFVVKLFDWDTLEADEEMLCFALKYILHNVECSLINLSLGVCTLEGKELYDICHRLQQNGVTLVAAFDNNGAISYPAAFDCVIGVTSGAMCLNNNDVFICDCKEVNVCAKGRQQRLRWLHNQLIVGSGNSYACAHITGILSEYLQKSSINALSLLERLSSGVIHIGNHRLDAKWKYSPVSEYKKAVLFPFNKEMHSIIRFQDLLSFEIIDVYDLKYSARVGSSTNDILHINDRNFIIRNIAEIDWESFDTFILGHTEELTHVADKPYLVEELMREVINHGKKLYSFDELTGVVISGKQENLYFHPEINENDVPDSPFGKLYRQDKPVLGVFGTSSRQGKFTLQLTLRRKLLAQGYNVAQLGTEPSALLFGMNAVFPNGYNSSVMIRQKETVAYLNAVLHDISKGADIILVGGQSGIVIRDDGNLDNYNFSQIDFLYATQPDAIILCINVHDDESVIERTIMFVEAAVGCHVIALVAFPFCPQNMNSSYQALKALERDGFLDYKVHFERKFGVPAYLLNDPDDIDALMKLVLTYFSE